MHYHLTVCALLFLKYWRVKLPSHPGSAEQLCQLLDTPHRVDIAFALQAAGSDFS